MPYDPQAIGQEQRTLAYRVMGGCGAGVVIGLISHLAATAPVLAAGGAGLGAAGLCMSAYTSQYDEYFRTLCAAGHRWLAAGLALALFGWCLSGVVSLSCGAGSALGSDGAVTRCSWGLAGAGSVDAFVIAMAAALMFYAGFVFAWAKASWQPATGEA
jgi:hypothetical protein